MPLMSPGGSSPSRPSTTSCSSRSRSGCRSIVAVFHTAWVRTRNPRVAAADEVLRQALPHQLRPRARHRHRAGVPVRHELERLLALRRRHLRRPARHRGAARVLPRVDLPRPLDLRLGPAPREAARRLRSGWCTSAPCCRRTSSSRPTRSCSTRSGYTVQPRDRSRRADRLLRRAHQQGAARDLPARHRSRPTWSAARSSWASRSGCCARRAAHRATTRPMYRTATRHRRDLRPRRRRSASSSPVTSRARS